MTQELGKIEEVETYEERTVAWKIPNFSSLIRSEKDKCASSKNIFTSGIGVYSKKSPNFSFVNNSWYFQLRTKISTYTIGMKVLGEDRNHSSVGYNTSVKKRNGSVAHIGNGIWKKYDINSWGGVSDEVAILPDLEEQSSSDVLTVLCTLKCGSHLSTQPSALEKSKLKKLIKLDTLSQNFKDLYSNKDSCDTTLLVKDTKYRVHRTVLVARSSVFAAMFQHDSKEKQEDKQKDIVTIPDCHPESFEQFLEFLYCGKLEGLSFCNALHLYETSDKYDVQELKTFCVEYLIENFTVGNMCDAVIIADKYDDVKLISEAQNFFNKKFNDIFQTSEWESLMKNNYRLAHKLLKEMPKMKVVK